MKYDVNRLRKRRIEESVKKRINGKVCEREKQQKKKNKIESANK